MSETAIETPAGGDEFDLAAQVDPTGETPATVEATATETANAEVTTDAPEAPQAVVTPEIQAWFDREWEARQAASQQYEPATGTEGATPGEEQPFVFDPFAEDAGQQLDQLISSKNQELLNQIQQVVSPLLDSHSRAANEEGMQRMRDIVSDYEQRPGNNEFTAEGKEAALKLPTMFYTDAVNKYGNTPRAGEVATEQAAAFVARIEAAAEARGFEKGKNHLSTLAGQKPEPGAAGAGVVTIPEGGDETTVARHWASIAAA